MSIKTSISLFLLMMGFSFAAYSETFYTITSSETKALPSGTTYTLAGISNALTSYGCEPYYGGGRIFQSSISTNNGIMGLKYDKYENSSCSKLDRRGLNFSVRYTAQISCPSGSVLDPDTGKCEELPICEPPAELDPDTLECVVIPFCERDSTTEQIFAAEQSCAAQNGIFTFSCSDFLESLEMKCTQPNECALGFPNWPECLDDLDPTDDITPPSGGFNPSTPPTANPDAPSFDKPEPDDVTPTDTTDKAVLEAVQNANRDSNEGFKALSTDLNNGFTDTNNALAKLNSTNTAIGESIVEQMNQDYAIHQANKDLALQQTGAINAGSASVVGALGTQTGALTGALGEQTGAITDAIGELADKIPEACDPALDERGCENPHGLGDNYIETTFGQMTKVTDDALDEGHSFVETKLQSVINNPLTNENESIMNNATSHLLNLLDYNQSCRALSFEANGRTYSIDCQVSSQIKLVLSFLIGMYTLMTLIDILLDGIVPLGAKPSATRYA
ncbi:hypothetical protein [Vibrio lentus]|uniref:hypothetical protein n=1 Tax=Vibrio lentus TaxID=136468 RepID=UPI000C835828|nr:hypothetical protein [Vibrio lentus]PMK90852.1 hypothetical protein BCT88_01060 [Vibrio lentus]